jgi:hypothetical protein
MSEYTLFLGLTGQAEQPTQHNKTPERPYGR